MPAGLTPNLNSTFGSRRWPVACSVVNPARGAGRRDGQSPLSCGHRHRSRGSPEPGQGRLRPRGRCGTCSPGQHRSGLRRWRDEDEAVSAAGRDSRGAPMGDPALGAGLSARCFSLLVFFHLEKCHETF